MASPVLIIEDDVAIRRGLVDALTYAGFEPLEAGDGESGLRRALVGDLDLLLLDLSLPHRDGLDVLQSVRAAQPGLPIILITARGSEDDRVRGLRLGADDYLVKPFSVRELMARVDAVLRRSAERARAPARIQLATGTVDLATEEIVHDDGTQVPLTKLEARLFRYLALFPGRLVTRDELLTHVWQLDPRHVRTRAIDVALARLRRKLRDDDAAVLVTVRGRGYRLETRCDAAD
ncbi:MAG: response regulator transcription factor [Acidobacteriota bacterium]